MHYYNNADFGSCLWFVGWLFTIGFLRLSFWRGVLAVIVWPYFIGEKYAHKSPSHTA
jgi:hypothetical protein